MTLHTLGGFETREEGRGKMEEKVEEKERRVTIVFSGGGWVNVRSSIRGAHGRGGDVRQAGYHLEERRWSVTKTPLTEVEKERAIELLEELIGRVSSC